MHYAVDRAAEGRIGNSPAYSGVPELASYSVDTITLTPLHGTGWPGRTAADVRKSVIALSYYTTVELGTVETAEEYTETSSHDGSNASVGAA